MKAKVCLLHLQVEHCYSKEWISGVEWNFLSAHKSYHTDFSTKKRAGKEKDAMTNIPAVFSKPVTLVLPFSGGQWRTNRQINYKTTCTGLIESGGWRVDSGNVIELKSRAHGQLWGLQREKNCHLLGCYFIRLQTAYCLPCPTWRLMSQLTYIFDISSCQ